MMIKKNLLIFNLIIKTVVELAIVCTLVASIGLIVFICTYIYKSINNAIDEYYGTINNT